MIDPIAGNVMRRVLSAAMLANRSSTWASYSLATLIIIRRGPSGSMIAGGRSSSEARASNVPVLPLRMRKPVPRMTPPNGRDRSRPTVRQLATHVELDLHGVLSRRAPMQGDNIPADRLPPRRPHLADRS